jgi:hypothetical protein
MTKTQYKVSLLQFEKSRWKDLNIWSVSDCEELVGIT